MASVRRGWAGRERGRDQWKEGEGGHKPLIVKANYCKRDNDDRGRAKDNVRYITHRRDLNGQKVTRDLFGFDGELSKQPAYRMIDAAPKKGRYYYRVVISPDPRREDRYKDLDLRNLTIATMLRLEERYGKSIQFVAVIHDDHAAHRHVHTLVILNGRRLTSADFASLRAHARNRALNQRRYKDRVRRLAYLKRQRRAVKDLHDRRDAAAAKLETCSIALRQLKLDVLRLRAGSQTHQRVTSLALEAMALAEDVDSALYVADELARTTGRPSGRQSQSARPG